MTANAGAQKKYPTLAVRVSQIQLERWERLADGRGMTLAKLVRDVLDREARAEEAGRITPADYDRMRRTPETFT